MKNTSAPAALLQKFRDLVNTALDQSLPSQNTPPPQLHEAMRYAVLGGGKRLRPLLCLSTASAFGLEPEKALPAAVALELLHTSTLVHDDLPAMDNDDLRRGRPTAHKVFGEAQAILAGDALLLLSLEVLAQSQPKPPYNSGDLVQELARAVGSTGVIGGQWEDIASEGKDPEPQLLDYIHLHKTAALLRSSCRLGAMLGGADAHTLDQLSLYGQKLGLAFQIVDDILNATSTPEVLGKACGSDAAHKKMTYVALYGIDASRQHARALVAEITAILQALPIDSALLQLLANLAVERVN